MGEGEEGEEEEGEVFKKLTLIFFKRLSPKISPTISKRKTMRKIPKKFRQLPPTKKN
jgi:hypothetical protein